MPQDSGEAVGFDSVVVRFSGEIWIKGAWTIRFYVRCLLRNIKRTLKSYDLELKRVSKVNGRLFLWVDEAEEVASRLSRVFGISSVSPALETTSRLEDIIDKAVFLACKRLSRGNSFAVRCRRVGSHPYGSRDVCEVVGRRILEEFGGRLGVRVDLKTPDARFGVEVRGDRGFVYSDVVKGVGGMPLGTQPRLVGLLSGGFDSAVACWLVMKRGAPVVPLYLDNSPFTDEKTTEKAKEVAKILFGWAIGGPKRMFVVPFGEVLRTVVEEAPRRLTCVLCKRMMYRIAECIAKQVNAEGIVTGEAIGEQASQTLHNLRVLDEAVQNYPVHRPLLGFDKVETDRLARKIGTYDISSWKAQGCTAVPKKPTTKARLEEVKAAEEKLNVKKIIKNAVKSLRDMRLE
ncbi:MAG: tRNA 4-thiouridine(8) synthase ThiI [Candidatus Bathyarchaeota archaeon]|nr:tRNA 4-thiouridine(8) synthase ThiI [Candidatus Bathyarchaeota archaeon]MDH5732796.1 tRNA 4-thiouridine(8) synthase ThiI [Candidatus Bathyarchaeota archaeon]